MMASPKVRITAAEHIFVQSASRVGLARKTFNLKVD